jgi:chemotaxis signal transduction protein
MPVVDLAPLLGLSPRGGTTHALGLVLGHGAWTAAAAVDSVLGLEPLQAAEGAARRRFAAESAAGVDGSIPVLDAGAMLSALRGAMGAGAPRVNH